MGTLADLLIPLAGSISNDRAIKMREACDALEAKIDVAQRGMNHAHDLISLLTERVKDLERDNLDRRLTKLESAVDVLDRERVETLKLRVNGLEHTQDRHKRTLEFIDYERASPLEDRVSMLESATNNIALHTDETLRAVRMKTGEGSAAGQNGSMTAGASRPHSEAPAPSPASSVPTRVDTGVVQFDNDWPGVFIRGDHAHLWGGQLLQFIGTRSKIDVEQLHGLAVLLTSCDMRKGQNEVHVIDRRAPAAPVVDVRRLLIDYHIHDGIYARPPMIEAMTRALASQGVKCKEVQP